MEDSGAYFIRESASEFTPTALVSGGWNPKEQHIAPAIGLLAHVIESDFRARRDEDLRLTRLSCDILGTIPIETVSVEVSVLRPGRTIELVEARMSHGGRAAVIARAWLTATYETEAITGSGFDPLPPREGMKRWGLDTSWPGQFVASLEIWRVLLRQGRANYWMRTVHELIKDEAVSPTARMLGMIDGANGVAALVDPADVAFPNVDLTVHLFREPEGEWIGLDTSQSYGPSGAGLTHSILHDKDGPLGAFSQALTVRPRV